MRIVEDCMGYAGARLLSITAAVVTVALCGTRVGAKEPAKERLPSFYYLPSQNDNSALSMECDGEQPFSTLHCRFTQVMVRHSSPTDEEQRKMTEELNATPADEMRKNAAEMCARLNTPSADSVLPQPGSTKEPSRAQFMAGFKPLCACRDVACARRELTSLFLELERDTCKVSATTFEADFTRALGERKWVSNPGPQGLCNVVTVVVIESDESGLLWTYTQTSLAADTTAEFCKGIELNGPMVNSWKAMDRTFSRCRTIKFGL